MNSKWFFLAGLSAGIAAALLFAPQAGKRTQKDISRKAQRALDQVADAGKQVSRQIEQWAG